MSLQLDRPLLLSGDLYLSEGNYGAYTNRTGPIETDAFTIALSSATVEQKSKAVATYGQVRSSVVLPGNITLALTFLDAGAADALALILMGTKSTISVAGATVTDEAVTGVLDRWVSLAKANVTAGTVSVATVAVPGTPLVEGTDYEINYRRGWIKALNAGTAVDLLVDYTHAVRAGSSVAMATNSQFIRRVELDGVNLHDGKPVYVELYRVKLRSEAQLSLKDNQHATAGLSGVIETPTGLASPGRIELED